MNVLDYAIQMERDGEQYYRELAAGSPTKGLASICNLLAAQEVKHIGVLQALKAGRNAHVEAGTLRRDAKNVFRELREQEPAPELRLSQLDLYRKALDIERKSREFYRSHAGETESPAARSLFHTLAAEEHLHEQMLETLIEFVSRPEPGNWLENAEWYHHEEY